MSEYERDQYGDQYSARVEYFVDTNHIDSEHVENSECKFACEKRETRCLSEADLKMHIENVHGPDNFECNDFDQNFTGKSHLERHNRKAQGTKKFEFENCTRPIKFLHESNLQLQHRDVHGPKNFECKNSDTKFSQKCNLERHIENVHGRRKFVCQHCDKKFSRNYDLERHRNVHTHVPKNFVCQYCDRKFGVKYYLKRHIENVHDPKNFGCNDCDKRFGSRRLLKKHNTGVHSPKQFGCKDCDQKFCSKYLLGRHKSVHTPKNLVSNDCDEKFSLKSNPERHNRINHSSEKLECKNYDKKFRRIVDPEKYDTEVLGLENFEFGDFGGKENNKDLMFHPMTSNHSQFIQPTFLRQDVQTNVAPSLPVENHHQFEIFECKECNLKFKDEFILVLHNSYEHSLMSQ